MEIIIEETSAKDQAIAKKSLSVLKNRIAEKADIINITLNNTTVQIPKKSVDLLINILSTMAEGKDVVLMPSDVEVSTQRAADLLNVSRPFIVKLLSEGKIPFTKVGTHRRIRLKDLEAYQSNLKEVRKRNIQFLINQGQELNLGY
jgi:excisionase family DNA binding protein